MKLESEQLRKPTLEQLKSFLDGYLQTHELGAAIRSSSDILRIDGSQKINSLSGDCVRHAHQLSEYLDTQGVPNKIVKSKNNHVHTFLKCETAEGDIIIDPSIGMFINYPNIFVGTVGELRDVFLSPERELFAGKRLWAIDHEITSREEWFQIIYET